MKSYIEPFIASKALSQNSQKAYRYDLQQFCQLVGERVNQDKLLLYQNSIANLSLSAKNANYQQLINSYITCIK